MYLILGKVGSKPLFFFEMLWGRESDVVADWHDNLLRLWRPTNSINRSGTEQDVGFGFSGGSIICGNS